MKKSIKKLFSFFNKSYFKYLVILSAFLIWMTFLDTNSLLIHAELNREIKKLKSYKELKRIEKELESNPLLEIKEKDKVTFELEKGLKGMNAVRVKKV